MKDNNIQSFKDVDFSSVSVPFIALFRGPDDYPGKYVARLFDLDKPTNAVMVRDEFEEIEEDIKTIRILYLLKEARKMLNRCWGCGCDQKNEDNRKRDIRIYRRIYS